MTPQQFIVGAIDSGVLPATDDYVSNPFSVEWEMALAARALGPDPINLNEIRTMDRLIRSADQGSFPRNPGA